MLNILGSPTRLCDGITRRHMLQAGGAGVLGLGLSDLVASKALARATETGAAAGNTKTFGKAKNCIILFLYGSPSQLETFDPKPEAPADIRGPFKTVASKLAGVHLSEHLPRTAGMLDKVALVRSMSHEFPIHGVAHALTGIDRVDVAMELNRHDPRHWPTMGSVMEYLDEQDHPGQPPAAVPRNIQLPWEISSRSAPHKRGGSLAGFLGARYNPVVFEFTGKSTSKTTYRPDDPFGGITPDCRFSLSTPTASAEQVDVTLDRLDRRRRLLEQFERSQRHLADTRAGETLDRFQQMAFSVITSPTVHTALDLSKEPAAVRERYGYHLFGQSTLLARRMIEAGTRLATVFWDEYGQSCGAWDTHEKAESRLKNELCPGFDQAFTALIEDLESRGLLDETLVIVMGEHGRTPQPEKRDGNPDGRGHWSRAYSALFAGAGISPGQVVGQSDAEAAWVRERPVSPKDVLRTAYHLLGVDAERTVPDRLGRPYPLVSGGEIVRELLS